ncbi:MAG: hypothetical protein KME33_27180 [Aetokthonos hydrillicola CCALA 1050]|nr:hypothetical protein [Aetokthonos hydrillicola CCALA 1050]
MALSISGLLVAGPIVATIFVRRRESLSCISAKCRELSWELSYVLGYILSVASASIGLGKGNGAWGMGNGEWGMGNGEWGMGRGEWGMGHGAWGVGSIR